MTRDEIDNQEVTLLMIIVALTPIHAIIWGISFSSSGHGFWVGILAGLFVHFIFFLFMAMIIGSWAKDQKGR